MGCKSTGNNKRSIIDKNMKYDFDYYRSIAKSTSEPSYEVRMKLWEVREVTPKQIKKSLLSKYLFFKKDGNFETKIKLVNQKSNDNALSNSIDYIEIQGTLNTSGEISFCKKQRVLENNQVDVKYYEANLSFSAMDNGNPVTCIGKIYRMQEGEKIEVKGEHFELELPYSIWQLEYKVKDSFPIKMFVYMILKNSVFTGISHDARGFAMWVGREKNEKNDTKIVQQYLHHKQPDENGVSCYTYDGISDKIKGHKIEGTIIHDGYDAETRFVMKQILAKISGE